MPNSPHTQSVRAWLHGGAVAMQLRSYTDALLCFDRALALSSACVPALLNRAMCYHRLGNLSRAEEDYSAVIALAPVRYPLRDPCCSKSKWTLN